ncbi:hypothetical protein AB6A40_008532 [Gnathostoma spinigerum]|uniref:Uncharacterized protein n=1 Tax=Gnathostoma spinigerum TaxID=75299 RepID=A0ABD6EXM3_9BILA
MPALLSDANNFLTTVNIKENGTRRVVSNAKFSFSSVSEERESVIRMVYESQPLSHGITFMVGIFKHEARSVNSNIPVRAIYDSGRSSRIIRFIMNEAREMAYAMEENFGGRLTDSDFCFLVIPGANIIKASPQFLAIGIQNPVYRHPFALWRLIREAIASNWFVSRLANPIEKAVINGIISYLVESLVDEARKNNNEYWVSAALGEQLRNSLSHVVDEGVADEDNRTHINASNIPYGTILEVTPSRHVAEMMTNLIGKSAMYDALKSFLLETRQSGKVSVIKALNQVTVFHALSV